ncbi:aspartate kinase [Parasutterella excrementihominis]|uniref:aspartate kinase n=1 Tax=Parasutterella excrementihominis TaxID=487175 RepID=UPI0012BC37B6|nr:aspartate kinase [Parasutterella excrementihominis]MTT64899.1 aspartate kinase [Parasutterella excrementihominis]MTT92945.1 aspartate kinase [Parasutterella excrementihominis]
MALIVQKYGGTSVGSVERIKNVARRIAKWQNAGHQVVVVVSAMSGETNRLIALAKEIQKNPDPRELDVIASTGEQVTIGLLAMALQNLGVPARSYTGTQVRVLTDNAFTKARIKEIDSHRIMADLNDGKVVIVAGFQGCDEEGNITTLGRGGSDTSAVALAAALHADECLIFTDVDGIYTTDPRVVSDARKLDVVAFEEILGMASLGSKVLQIRSVEFAGKYRVPTRVLSSLTDPDIPVDEEANSGTLITFEEDPKMEKVVVSGIAFSRNEAKITLPHVPDTPGIAYKILGHIAEANIEVDMIVQNAAKNGLTDFSFTVSRNDLDKAMKVLEKEVTPYLGEEGILTDASIAKISCVGIGMRSHAGVVAKMFRILAEENINIKMISTSEIRTSIVVDEKYMELAVRALHKAFGLDKATKAMEL